MYKLLNLVRICKHLNQICSRTDETWNYTDDGTATTPTSTTTHQNVPYTINSNTIFANAYDDRAALVSHHSHIYSKKSGGDPADSAEYNLENELKAINARGRLIHSVVRISKVQRDCCNSHAAESQRRPVSSAVFRAGASDGLGRGGGNVGQRFACPGPCNFWQGFLRRARWR